MHLKKEKNITLLCNFFHTITLFFFSDSLVAARFTK